MKLFAALVLLSFSLCAQSKLQLRVFTSGADGFSVNSTLIYGEKDAILIDPQFVLSEAHRVAAGILESRKNLTTIYITHPHSDHYFGLAVLKQAFPNARIVALPETVAGIRNNWDARYKAWVSEYGPNIPATGPILPEEIKEKTLTLEGETLEITGGLMGDAPNNSMVWIPSLRAIVAGDILFAGAHFNVPRKHDEWLKSLDRILALNPSIVVPGHQALGVLQDVSIIEFMKNYMRNFDTALQKSKDANQFVTLMNALQPNLAMPRGLITAAEAAFPSKK